MSWSRCRSELDGPSPPKPRSSAPRSLPSDGRMDEPCSASPVTLLDPFSKQMCFEYSLAGIQGHQGAHTRWREGGGTRGPVKAI